MAHFKCLSCKTRVWRDGGPSDHLRDRCPGCGGPVEPVRDLTEVVGFRALRVRPKTTSSGYPAGRSIAEQISDTIARNDEARRRRIAARRRDEPAR